MPAATALTAPPATPTAADGDFGGGHGGKAVHGGAKLYGSFGQAGQDGNGGAGGAGGAGGDAYKDPTTGDYLGNGGNGGYGG